MKTKAFIISLLLCVVLPCLAKAKELTSDQLFKKYADAEWVKYASISEELMKISAGNNMILMPALMEMGIVGIDPSKIKSIKLITSENGGSQPAFIKDINELMLSTNYVELMSIKGENGQRMKMVAAKDKNNVITELLIYQVGNSTTLISLKGIFDEQSLSGIASSPMMMR